MHRPTTKKAERHVFTTNSPFHAIPAIMRDPDALRGRSEINFNERHLLSALQLEYLNSQHRIAAAKMFLADDNERWWLVHIYSRLSDKEALWLQQPPAERNLSDGQILLKPLNGETSFVNQLSHAKQKLVHTLSRCAPLLQVKLGNSLLTVFLPHYYPRACPFCSPSTHDYHLPTSARPPSPLWNI